nr:MAG TPA: protein of unknown function (DUF5522) [Caudoviricetes sp.]
MEGEGRSHAHINRGRQQLLLLRQFFISLEHGKPDFTRFPCFFITLHYHRKRNACCTSGCTSFKNCTVLWRGLSKEAING